MFDRDSENTFTIGIILLISLTILGIIYIIEPRSKNLEVTGFSWNRNCIVEENTTIQEWGWELPDDAILLQEKEALCGYRKSRVKYGTTIVPYQGKITMMYLPAGTETYFSETGSVENGDEPLYKTKYQYEVQRWVPVIEYPSFGNDKNPFWNETYSLEENQRVSKSEEYIVICTDKSGNEVKFSVDENTWQKIKEGDEFVMMEALFEKTVEKNEFGITETNIVS